MIYNLKYLKNKLKEYKWFIVMGDSKRLFISRSPEPTVDRLTIYCMVDIKTGKVYHWGVWAFMLPHLHLRVIDGYLKRKYGKKFKHYSAERDHILEKWNANKLNEIKVTTQIY